MYMFLRSRRMDLASSLVLEFLRKAIRIQAIEHFLTNKNASSSVDVAVVDERRRYGGETFCDHYR